MIINPKNFFEEELIKEFSLYQNKIKPQSVLYLSNFLEKSIQPDYLIEQSKPKYIFELIQDINNETIFANIEIKTKKLAETTLFISSFFPELILKRNNNLNYYLNIGIQAYNSLESLNQKTELKIAYQNISNNFEFICSKIRNINKNVKLTNEQCLDLFEETLNPYYLKLLK